MGKDFLTRYFLTILGLIHINLTVGQLSIKRYFSLSIGVPELIVTFIKLGFKFENKAFGIW